MSINILINSDLPNLYKFLTLCIIEQRGNHNLYGFDKNATVGDTKDINFIKQFSDSHSWASEKIFINL